MIYSLWNQPARQYDYYETTKTQLGANTPSPKHIRSGELGVPVEEAGWPLPAGAHKVGSGPFAKGRIASRGGQQLGLGTFSMGTNTVAMVGLGLAALLLWRSGFMEK